MKYYNDINPFIFTYQQKRILHILSIKPRSSVEIMKRMRESGRVVQQSFFNDIKILIDRNCIKTKTPNSIRFVNTRFGSRIFKELKKTPSKQNIPNVYTSFFKTVNDSGTSPRYWMELLKKGLSIYDIYGKRYIYIRTSNYMNLSPTDYFHLINIHDRNIVTMKRNCSHDLDCKVSVLTPLDDPLIYDQLKKRILANKRIPKRMLENPIAQNMMKVLSNFMNNNTFAKQPKTKIGTIETQEGLNILL